MKYYKIVENGYLPAIGTDCGGVEITEEEYNEIKAILPTKPAATETTDYRLRDDLTWEEYEIDPPDPDPELDGDEALAILLGGAV